MPEDLWNIATSSELGGRNEQQDSFAHFETKAGKVLAVCDGVGGHSGGKEASQSAVKALREAGRQISKTSKPEEALQRLANAAHEAVQEVRQHGPHASASSTLALAFLTTSHAHLGIAGDSRVYWVDRDGNLHHTRDDSVAQMLVDRGQISEKELRHHPDRNRLTKSLGSHKITPLETETIALDQIEGLLLASDGFWEHTSDDSLIDLIRTRAPKHTSVLTKAVKDAVREAGESSDNATALLLVRSKKDHAEPEEEKRQPEETDFPKGFLIAFIVGLLVIVLYLILT